MIQHYLFVFAGLLVTLQAFSQNTFPHNGNVSIGTTSPSATLDVNGLVALAGNSSHLDNRYGDHPLSFLKNSGKIVIG